MANVSSFSGAMPVIPGGTVELGYSQITSAVNVTSTSTSSPTTVISAITVICDGSPILVEFYSQNIYFNGPNAGDECNVGLWVDGAESQRYWARAVAPGTTDVQRSAHAVIRLTPSAGSHTFSVTAFSTNGTRYGIVNAGSGGAGASPAFLRVSKIVNQNDGLKPFWTPPVVTSLPSQATVGDQVLMQFHSTGNPNLYTYTSGGWKPACGGLVHISTKTFSGVSSVEVDGVFSSNFRNYRLNAVLDSLTATGAHDFYLQLRKNGTASTSGYDHSRNYHSSNGGGGAVVGYSNQSSWLLNTSGGSGTGISPMTWTGDIHNPYESTLNTAYNGLWVSGEPNAPYSGDWAGTHRTDDTYDGYKIAVTAGNMTGRILVYGWAE